MSLNIPIFGLQNDSSVCYLNSLLQCIFSCKNLNKTIFELPKKQYRNNHINIYKELIEAVTSIEDIVNNDPFREIISINPKTFKKIFIDNSKLFTYGRQEDADEFLLDMLNQLHECIKTKVDVSNDLKAIDHENDLNYLHYINNYKNDFSFITKLFHIQNVSKIFCNACKHILKKYDISCQYYIDITINNHQKTLEECIKMQKKPELLDDYKCDSCEKQNTSYKMTMPSILPDTLVIVLKRFTAHNVRIDVPLTDFNMSKFIDKKDTESLKKFNSNIKNQRYQLIGAIFHMGTTQGGHYYSVCKRGGNWWFFNDEDIRFIRNIDSKIFSSAYILFYQRYLI